MYFFPCEENSENLLLTTFISFNYIYHAIRYIPSVYLSYNWMLFITGYLLTAFIQFLLPSPTSVNANLISFSMLFVCF